MSESAYLHRGIFGLTGGMGSGKSSVAAYLCEAYRARLIDADQVCRQLLEPHERGWAAICNTFGGEYLQPDQSIDRKKLRREIFCNKEVRERINGLLHPLVRSAIATDIEKRYAAETSCRVVVEVPLLYEARWEDDFEAVIVVYADEAHCLERIMKRDHISREEAECAMSAQWPLAEKVLLADHVIDNNGSWEDTCLEILHLGKLLWNDEKNKNKKYK